MLALDAMTYGVAPMSHGATDDDTFAALAERHRAELRLHCYRMLGSIEDAEDAVQETLLRAWRRRELFEGRSTFRAWLYRIATNCCLDALDRRARRVLPTAIAGPADPNADHPPAPEILWLEPYPDRLLEEIVDEAAGPPERVVTQETVELVFMAAIQHLPPRQRATLILRDVLGWSAREAADIAGMTTAAANSALQRARGTMRQRLPERRLEWPRNAAAEAAEQRLLERYMGAWARSDVDGIVALLREDARLVMPPIPAWFVGRAAIAAVLARYPLAAGSPRHIHVPVRANRQPAFAVFLESPGGDPPVPLGVEVVRIEDGLIAELDIFLQPRLVGAFGVTPPPA
jgi:RNA polymerase sigma-70 factor (ECF subfamily)